jgi:hypothetical protein
MRADAVVVPTVAGERYVVSMFGTISDWVRNIEAAYGDAVISHGGSVRVRLVPVRRLPISRRLPRSTPYIGLRRLLPECLRPPFPEGVPWISQKGFTV